MAGARRRWERRHLAMVALPVLILVTAAFAAWELARAVDNRREARIGARAESTVIALQRRLGAYTDVLYGIRGLFEASSGVSLREFHDHFEALDVERRYTGVRAVGVAEVAPTDDASALVRRVRRDIARSGLGYPRFHVHGGPTKLERRLVVDYIEPASKRTAGLGLDLFSEPVRRRAAERALESGQPIASAPVSLLDASEGPAFVIFLPFHGERTTGVGFAGVRVADLVRDVEAPVEPADLRLEDVGPAPGASVNERARRVVTFRSGVDSLNGTSIVFDVLGRRWALRYAPRDAVVSATERLMPWIVLFGGALIAGLTAWLLITTARTERRALSLATKMTAELERSNAELERFASIASHDLREPLRSITGFITLLARRHASALDTEARSWIGYALDGAERMNALIGDLLEYSRAGRPLDPGHRPRADLQAAWADAVASLAAAIEESGATVTAGPLPAVAADQREMNQVMQNLLGNAIKYRGDRAPVVRADAERRDGAWAISVQDNGIGIDGEQRDRIFVLFQRLHTRDDYEGTGMGLSIVKKIVEARGGSVGVESAPGEGSRFTVVLPTAD